MTRRSAIIVGLCFAALFGLSFWQNFARTPSDPNPPGQTVLNSPNALGAAQPIRQEGVIDVRSYGAVGDGITDDTPAVQSAIDAVPTSGYVYGGVLYFPPGIYRLTNVLIPTGGISFIGACHGVVLLATRDGQAIFQTSSTASTRYLRFQGLTFRASGSGCYGIRAGTDRYLDKFVFEDCEFYADLACGVHGRLANCRFVNCRFGLSGTPGPVCQAIYGGGDTTNVAFTNQFTQCWFEHAQGCHAAVEFGTGNTTLFESCVFQVLATRAYYARGMAQTRFENCNFEAIRPADANHVIFDVGQDAVGNRAKLVVNGCKISQQSGSTLALAWVEGYGEASFEDCQITALGNYYTMRAGPAHDSGIARLINNLVLGEASTVSETGYYGYQTFEWAETAIPFRTAPVSRPSRAALANDIYLDDGTNTGSGAPGFRLYRDSKWCDIGGSQTPAVLLGSGRAAMQNGGPKTTIYVVPARKRAIITQVIIHSPTASLAGGVSFGLGCGPNANNWKQGVDLSGLTGANDYMIIANDNVRSTVLESGDEFGIKPKTGGDTNARATVMVFGIEF